MNVNRDAANARRVAQRRLAALQEAINEAGITEGERNYLQKRINRLHTEMEQTKAKTASGYKRAAESREKAINLLRKTAKGLPTQKQMQKNIVTRQQFNLASTKASREINQAGGKVGKYSYVETKVIMRATQHAWNHEGVGENERFMAMMEYYGVSNLDDLFDAIIKENEVRISLTEKLMRGAKDSELTEEEKALKEAEEAEDKSDASKSSPKVLINVKPYGGK